MIDDPIAALLSRIAAQDRAAFRSIYSDTSAKLMGVLLRILGSRAEAEDALQEVFTRVWLRAGRFDAAKGRGMTWLIALARNHAIDRLRARHDHAGDSDEMETVADPSPRAETRLIAAMIKAPENRLTYTEIINLLDPTGTLSLATLEVRIARLHSKIKPLVNPGRLFRSIRKFGYQLTRPVELA